MGNDNSESGSGKEDKLQMDFLDCFETYQIMSEVFWEYVPKKDRVKALGQVAERIMFEIKNTEDNKSN